MAEFADSINALFHLSGNDPQQNAIAEMFDWLVWDRIVSFCDLNTLKNLKLCSWEFNDFINNTPYIVSSINWDSVLLVLASSKFINKYKKHVSKEICIFREMVHDDLINNKFSIKNANIPMSWMDDFDCVDGELTINTVFENLCNYKCPGPCHKGFIGELIIMWINKHDDILIRFWVFILTNYDTDNLPLLLSKVEFEKN